MSTDDETNDHAADDRDVGDVGDRTHGRPSDDSASTSGRPGVPAVLWVAGLASLAAGAIHATAAGAHGEARQAAIAFSVVAVAQIGWGAMVLRRSHRLLTPAGAVVNVAALGGWLLAKTSGIGFVDGLEESEGVQFADASAAALAAVAAAAALLTMAPRLSWTSRARPAVAGGAALAALALVVPAMVSTGGHSHAGGDHGHEGGDEMAGMDHGDGHGDGGHSGHDMEAAAVAAEPYDATLPVDLGGIEGVSAEQQDRAEDLVTVTLERLPQFAADGPNEADEAELNRLGYYSIGDGGTGFEHWVNWASIDDEHILDPDHPESLVFKVDGPEQKTLAAAMFMLTSEDGLDDVPDVGGPLTQWHVHEDLCYAGTSGQWVVADVAMPPEECRQGTSRLGPPVPMIHVWIQPHECGPFSALDGVGAGQVAEGETQSCNHAHGSSEAAISSEAAATIGADGSRGG